MSNAEVEISADDTQARGTIIIGGDGFPATTYDAIDVMTVEAVEQQR